jgi:acyl-CoA synthetase (AMP-forming)/AMP-acid ligase II
MSVVDERTDLVAMVTAQAEAHGETIAFEFEGRQTSFAEFHVYSNRVANGLIALGARPGERIAYLGKNSDVYFELLFGAMKAKAVMTPVNWRLAGAEIAFILADSRASVLFVGPELVELVSSLKAKLPGVRVVMATEGGGPGLPDFTAWRDAQSNDDPGLTIDARDVAVQIYTSGTTGTPKGAMLSHANFRLTTSSGPREWNRWTADDVTLLAVPTFHIGGTAVGAKALCHGAKCVVFREFDPVGVLDAIEHLGITRLFLVPAAMQFVVRLPRAREADFSRLRYVIYGASPIPAALLRECMEIFRCEFVQIFGMTETAGIIVVLEPEDHVEGRDCLRSAGKAMPGVELAIVDPEGNRLPAGAIGEIVTRSGSNMVGYWNLPEATAETLDKDGWLHTGDAGYLDEEGYLYIHDRIKNMIISGGENVYPAEVESAICDHPAVAEAAVIGVPDANWGEAVKAVVVMKPGNKVEQSEIINFVRGRIAGYKTPRSIDFVDVLPRNPSGKILHRQLREPYWAAQQRRVN